MSDAAFAAFCTLGPAAFRARYDHSALRHDPRFAARIGASGVADYATFLWFACRGDPGVVLAFAPSVATVLRDADEAVAFAALVHTPKCYPCVPRRFRENRGFVLAAVAANPLVVLYLPRRWQHDRALMLQAAQLHGVAAWYYGFPFGGDPEFAPWFRLTRAARRWRRVRGLARLRAIAFWWCETALRRHYHAAADGSLVGAEARRLRRAYFS